MPKSTQSQALENLLRSAGVVNPTQKAEAILTVARTLESTDNRSKNATAPAPQYVAMALCSMGARDLARRFLALVMTASVTLEAA